MIGIAGLLTRALARVEPRHWAGVGASAVLHLAVIFGWQSAPPPEPEPISFEITLDPPDAVPLPKAKLKALAKQSSHKKIAKKAKPKQRVAKNKPKESVPREAHLLDANWKTETKNANNVPELALPDAQSLGLRSETPSNVEIAQTSGGAAKLKTARVADRKAVSPGSVNAGESAAELSEPEAASIGGGNVQPGRIGDAGLALTNSPSLAASQSANLDTGSSGAQASTAALAIAGASAGAEVGGSPAVLGRSGGTQTALDAAVGAGMQAATVSPAQSGSGASDPQGIKLAVSSALAALSPLPQGKGSQAATSQATLLAQGAAPALPAGVAGQGGIGGTFAGSHSVHTGGAKPMAAGAAAGHASSGEKAGSRVGRGQEPPSQLGSAARTSGAMPGGARVSSRPGNSGPQGKTVALAPGEPGGSPGFAVMLQPVVASLANPYLSARPGVVGTSGRGEAASGSSHTAARSPGEVAAQRGQSSRLNGSSAIVGVSESPAWHAADGKRGGAGGLNAAPAQMASAALLKAAGESGRPPVILHATQPVAVKVVRPDTEIERLDVLAPSNYCPLPLPGHAQPENRVPQPAQLLAEQPAYALDNPSINYPVLANIRGVEGRVTVRVEVLADGRPGKMWLKQSSGSGILDQDAQAQLKHWRFVPARKNGQPVSAWIDVPVLYRLSQARP